MKAQAQFYDGSPAVECIITDYSAAGARMEWPGDREPPGAFDLFVPSRADTRHALLRWQTPDAIGVEFIQARGTSEDLRLSELLVRMSQIEEELRGVRAGAVLAQAAGAAGSALAAPAIVPADDGKLAILEERVAALETTEMPDLADVSARVAALEERNGELLHALRQTLSMLGELRDATAPLAKAS